MSDEIMGNDEVNEETQNDQPTSKTFTQDELDRIVDQRLARERKKLDKKLDGIDLEEARRLMQEREQAELDRQKERGEFDKVLKQTVEKKDHQITQMQQRLHQVQIDGALLSAASQQSAVNPEQVVSLVKGSTRLAEDGSVEVLDDSGTVRYNDKGEPYTVPELMTEFLTANPHFVKATPGGAGSSGAAGGSTQKPASVADMLANWENGGKQAYAQLKGKR